MATLVAKMYSDLRDALVALPKWERWFHIFWLAGPFILLIERTPSDVWLSVIALSFLVRSALKSDWQWCHSGWVRCAFLFWAACLVSASMSKLPLYSLGEAIVWFRFPIFAASVAFWLGCDRRILYGMLFSIAVAMALMCCIIFAEFFIIGLREGRLSWPYGDKVPGNYLAKVCLPASVVAVALVTSARGRIASLVGVLVMFSIAASVMTGERINFLIRACSAMLAAVSWRPKIGRVIAMLVVEGVAVASVMTATPFLAARFINHFLNDLPVNDDSPYFQTMAPGIVAFEEAKVWGVGPGNLRFLCEEIIGSSSKYDCHPHPHNYYIQMLGEVGIVGFLTGVLFLGSIIWACAKPALRDRSNVVVATMWIVPFAFFWPIASTADFFGQWNNIFMWSAVAVALAGAQIGSQDQPGTKP